MYAIINHVKHEGSPNDAKIFDEIMQKLKKRRIIRRRDRILFDKGYFSKDNYQTAIIKHKTSILIFP
ncbi:transposase [Methanobrevibacter sp. TMH8]|uniref:transposase n=1 Tax=Methanobrevibacter sp. TMH8 TaxID=2848611 RepID=UPI003183EE75|nr:transposase [Methanobrevibacter sp. TMH8]